MQEHSVNTPTAGWSESRSLIVTSGFAPRSEPPPGARFVKGPPSCNRPIARMSCISLSWAAASCSWNESILYEMVPPADSTARITLSLYALLLRLFACRASFSWWNTRSPLPLPCRGQLVSAAAACWRRANAA